MALALSLVLTLALAELAGRLLFGTPMPERLPLQTIRANRERGWEMVPGELHYTYLHPVRVNALGLRGPEVEPREQARDEVRVLALGDSLVYGQGVADEDTIPARLVGELQRRDLGRRRFSVVNGGLRAYDTPQELALLRELEPRIDADVVVLFWYWNDLRERDIGATYRRLSASGPITFDVGAPMSGRRVLKWRLWQLLRHSALVMTAYDSWRARTAPPPDERDLEEGMRRLEGYLADLRQLGRSHGFRPFLAAIPDPATVIGPHWSRELAQRACELATAADVPSVSLLSAVAAVFAATGDLPVLPYDGHYRGEANAAMAGATAELILAHLHASGGVAESDSPRPTAPADTVSSNVGSPGIQPP